MAISTNAQAPSAAAARSGARLRMWAGALLLCAGFFGHCFAALAIGGSYVAFRDHVAGFLLLTVVSALVLAAAGRFFWKGRHDVTFLAVGAVQAVLGFIIYLMRFHV